MILSFDNFDASSSFNDASNGSEETLTDSYLLEIVASFSGRFKVLKLSPNHKWFDFLGTKELW